MNKINKLESMGVEFTPMNYLEFRIKFPNINYKVKKKSTGEKYLS